MNPTLINWKLMHSNPYEYVEGAIYNINSKVTIGNMIFMSLIDGNKDHPINSKNWRKIA